MTNTTELTSNRTSPQQEIWDNARASLKFIRRVPPTFTTPIRTLMIDVRNGGLLSPASQFLTNRLLRSKTLKARFYFAALTFHGDKISNSAYLSSLDIVRLYAPDELAAVIGLVFLFKKVEGAARAVDQNHWNWIADHVTRYSEIGGHLGYALPTIGVSKAILAESLRYLALGAFLINDPVGFDEYRRDLSKIRMDYCPEYEYKRWGYSHLEVAGNMLQLLGFGVGLVQSFMTGIGENPPANDSGDRLSYEYSLATIWINNLNGMGLAPEMIHIGKYFPLQKDLYKLLYEVNLIRDQGSKYNWLRRTSDEINPQKTPQLYQEFLQELQQASVLEDFYKQNLPSDILEGLSPDEMKELSAIGVAKEDF